MEIIRFNQKLYNLEAVKKSVEEFKNLANFTIKELDGYIEVKIDKVDQEVKDILRDEFANYVLGVMS